MNVQEETSKMCKEANSYLCQVFKARSSSEANEMFRIIAAGKLQYKHDAEIQISKHHIVKNDCVTVIRKMESAIVFGRSF